MTRAQKLRNYVAGNTVPVTVVPRTVIQEPLFFGAYNETEFCCFEVLD